MLGSVRAQNKAKHMPDYWGKEPPVRSSLKQSNNSWYAGEGGEGKTNFSVGRIPAERSRSRAAWEKSGPYTQGRDPANDGNRYSYASDCTNAVQRDYSLRFANPAQAVKANDAFTLLPPLKFVEKVSDAKAHRSGGSSMPGAAGSGGGAVHHRATAVQARQGRVAGVEQPQRFTVVPGPQQRR